MKERLHRPNIDIKNLERIIEYSIKQYTNSTAPYDRKFFNNQITRLGEEYKRLTGKYYIRSIKGG